MWLWNLQKYLYKAWQEAIKGGKVVLETHFPKLLNKAKEYHEGFKRAGLKTVPKTKQIVEKIKTVKKISKSILSKVKSLTSKKAN